MADAQEETCHQPLALQDAAPAPTQAVEDVQPPPDGGEIAEANYEASFKVESSGTTGSISKNQWRCPDPSCRNCNDYNETKCIKCGFTQPRSSGRYRSRRGLQSKPEKIQIWPTCVVSANQFYGHTLEEKKQAERIAHLLNDAVETSFNKVEQVITGMVCTYKTDKGWVRVNVKGSCITESCPYRQKLDSEACISDAASYWHIVWIDYGNLSCVPSDDLALVTKDMGNVSPKVKQYYLKGVYLPKEFMNTEIQGRTWLESIISNQVLDAECYASSKFRTYVKITVGDVDVNEAAVGKGFVKPLPDYAKSLNKKKESKRKGSRNTQPSAAGANISELFKSGEENEEEATSLVPRKPVSSEQRDARLLEMGHELMKAVVATVEFELQGDSTRLVDMEQLIEKVKDRCCGKKLNLSTKNIGKKSKEGMNFLEFNRVFVLTKEVLNELIIAVTIDLACYHREGKAYAHLHPENILVTEFGSALRAPECAKKCSITENWPFQFAEPCDTQRIKILKDSYNLGVLMVWAVSHGEGNFEGGKEAAINRIPLIKHLIAEEPLERPTVKDLIVLPWHSPKAPQAEQ
ncbi:uncharacterized protein [Procambarus clarkii]|uniref:uncharacterized protein n=1 Tax=Procambarus clarkii TaxID=6728 RepID=UPI001E66FE26|nr:uncharacterized protein LOC123756362 [Procambarus clarkii]